MCVQLVVVSLSAVFARAIYTDPFVSFDQDFAVAPLHPAGREFWIDFFSTAYTATAVAPAVSAAVATTVAAVNAAAAVAAAAATYIYLMPLRPRPSGPSVPLCVYKSTIIQKHDVKFLSFDSDDSGLARSAYFMGAWRIRYHCTVIDSWQHAQWLFWPEKNSFLYWSTPMGPRSVKNSHFFLQMKVFSFCAKIDPKRHKLKNPSKLKKKCQKNPCFLRLFWIFLNFGAILAHQTSTGMFSGSWSIFWHPWDPWGRVNSGNNFWGVQTATVRRTFLEALCLWMLKIYHENDNCVDY